jgi:hypothetical protein
MIAARPARIVALGRRREIPADRGDPAVRDGDVERPIRKAIGESGVPDNEVHALRPRRLRRRS